MLFMCLGTVPFIHSSCHHHDADVTLSGNWFWSWCLGPYQRRRPGFAFRLVPTPIPFCCWINELYTSLTASPLLSKLNKNFQRQHDDNKSSGWMIDPHIYISAPTSDPNIATKFLFSSSISVEDFILSFLNCLAANQLPRALSGNNMINL